MKKQSGLFIVVLTLTGMILSSCMSTKEKKNLAIDPANMNTELKPGDDFYHFANGGWITANPIGDEYSQYGVFRELHEKNQKQLNDLIKEVSKLQDVEQGSAAQKIRDFYNSGMDTNRIDELGAKPVMKEFQRINDINTIEGIKKEIAYEHNLGLNPLFAFYGTTDPGNSNMVISTFSQGGIGLPDVDYYTSDDSRSKEIREKYVEHITSMFTLAGDEPEEARARAEKVMALETRLAKASMTRLERRDPIKTYNKRSFEKFEELSPAFAWNDFFAGIELETPDELNVRMPDFYKEVSLMMDEIPVEDWKAYLKWNVLNRNASYLSSDFEQADFDFFRAYLSGVKEMQPRWKRVMGTTSGFLGEPVGKLYVEKYFPPEAKERMLALVNNLKKAFGERIKLLDWMGDSTKQKALEKLQTMEVKIGYPDAEDWVDYSPMKVVAGDYLTNIYHGRAFLKRKNLNKIGKPVNKDEWVMPPQTVNAGYIPTYNQIVFPAGILQPPFFFMDADDAVNYGAIGVVIGHEMTHGFDDQGRLFDLHGNLHEWWTEEDSEKFNSKADGFVTQFDRFSILDSLHVNGRLTLGENIADNGGLNISWDAFQLAHNGQPQEPIMGFTPEQRFFLSYAQIWRQVIRDEELMNHLKEDVHSPGIARVNGALVNIDPFYEAFDIETENKMFVSKKDRVHVW